ncbi:hypothetical protein JTB14_036466 [Gonioctena quinquepunctata]|nr:hypothetical protein JTB14_036466 [Gonioctena quinquepunctata]
MQATNCGWYLKWNVGLNIETFILTKTNQIYEKMYCEIGCILVLFNALAASVRIPPNPCPQIFSYYKDSSGVLYGEANIPYDGSTTMQFTVNVSLAALFQKAELKLVLLTPLTQLINNVGRVTYNVFFPSQEIIPRITQITYNGHIYCQGPSEPLIPGYSGVTNIWYTTTFKYTRGITGTINTNQVYEPGSSDAEIPVKDPNIHQPTLGPITPIPNERGSEKDSSDMPETNYVVPNEFLQPVTQAPIKNEDYKCGISNDLVVPLILGGTNAEVGQYPWLTAIFALDNHGNYDYKCSGTLISQKHVITAGRCVQYYKIQVVKTEDILLVMGTNDLEHWSSNGAVTRKARHVDTHPDYKKNPDSAHADMSIISMDVPVQFSSVIRPVCLWKGDSDLYPITTKMGSIAGYGQDENAQKAGSLHAMKAKHTEIPIVSQFDCLLSDIAFTNITSDRTFCAGGKGSGPCIGDSGSGFVLNIDGVYYLRGIASFALSKNGKCEIQHKYAVFCDTAKFTDWVKSCMKN